MEPPQFLVTNNSQIAVQPDLAVEPPLSPPLGAPPLTGAFTDGSNSARLHLCDIPEDESSDSRTDSGTDTDISSSSDKSLLEPGDEPVVPMNPFRQKSSTAAQAWDLRKKYGETSEVLDQLMQYQGLEDVKKLFLTIKSKVDICREQDPDGSMNILKLERFNAVFQGNPGTGKTTVARLYAQLLHETGLLPSDTMEETSGMKVASEGPMSLRSTLEALCGTYRDGGVIFVDEAYQLMATYADGSGKQALDMILVALEKNIGRLAAIFVGYKDEMEPFFEHNPGLGSRIPC